jgi:hypothetical protein
MRRFTKEAMEEIFELSIEKRWSALHFVLIYHFLLDSSFSKSLVLIVRDAGEYGVPAHRNYSDRLCGATRNGGLAQLLITLWRLAAEPVSAYYVSQML